MADMIYSNRMENLAYDALMAGVGNRSFFFDCRPTVKILEP